MENHINKGGSRKRTVIPAAVEGAVPEKRPIFFHVNQKVDKKKRSRGLTVAALVCSPKDHYMKERGRTIATGRLASNPVVIGSIPEKLPDGLGRTRILINFLSKHTTGVIERIEGKNCTIKEAVFGVI